MDKKRQPWEWVVLFVALVALIVLAVSCNTPAKIARQNEKAYQRVITDSAMFKRLYNAGRRIYEVPCTNDTIIGDTEVLILSDTAVLPGTTDTIIRPDTIRITVTKTNRVTEYITDNRATHELQDSLHAARVREASFRGQLLEKDRQLAESRAEAAQWKKKADIRLVLLLAAIAVAVVVGIKSAIPSIKKLIGK